MGVGRRWGIAVEQALGHPAGSGQVREGGHCTFLRGRGRVCPPLGGSVSGYATDKRLSGPLGELYRGVWPFLGCE